ADLKTRTLPPPPPSSPASPGNGPGDGVVAVYIKPEAADLSSWKHLDGAAAGCGSSLSSDLRLPAQEAQAWGFKDGIFHNSIWLEQAAEFTTGITQREIPADV
ncbi:hypothetical protein INR49_006988, partial [Caranx melampygus]